jgi:hypothetical protein
MSTAVPLPAGTTLGKSYEYGVDVNLGTTESPDWQPVRRMFGFQHTPTPTTQDAQTYDDLGSPNSDVTAWGFGLAFSVKVNRSITTGLYLPEIEALLARTKPTAVAELAVIEVRWYHKPATGTPNPTDAGQGLATVSYSRNNTGPDGAIEEFAFTLTGKGAYSEIANPFTGWDASTPAVSSVTPSGEGSGELVTITGTNLNGATAVTFDAIAADDFQVVSSTTIIAILPVDGAGAVDVIVTTPGGSSTAVSYTRAA